LLDRLRTNQVFRKNLDLALNIGGYLSLGDGYVEFATGRRPSDEIRALLSDALPAIAHRLETLTGGAANTCRSQSQLKTPAMMMCAASTALLLIALLTGEDHLNVLGLLGFEAAVTMTIIVASWSRVVVRLRPHPLASSAAPIVLSLFAVVAFQLSVVVAFFINVWIGQAALPVHTGHPLLSELRYADGGVQVIGLHRFVRTGNVQVALLSTQSNSSRTLSFNT
jgi:hypothetical protein